MLTTTQDKIVILPDPPPDSYGPIVIPEAYRATIWAGTVVAAGEGRMTRKGAFIPTTVKAGDRVLIQTALAVRFDHEGTEYMLTREPELVGLIEGEGMVEAVGEAPPTNREMEMLLKEQRDGKVHKKTC